MEMSDSIRKNPAKWLLATVGAILVFLGSVWGMVTGDTWFDLWRGGGWEALTIKAALWLFFFLLFASIAIQLPNARALRFSKKGTHPMTLILVVVVSAFVGCAIWWLLPTPPVAPHATKEIASKPAPKVKTIYDHYQTDFPFFKVENKGAEAKTKDGEVLGKLQFTVWYDTATNSKFISIFIPHTDNLSKMCEVIAKEHQFFLDDAKKGFYFLSSMPGEPIKTDSRNLMFTGQIYIYHESDLSLGDLARLDQLFRDSKLSAQFRGTDYVSSRLLIEAAERNKTP